MRLVAPQSVADGDGVEGGAGHCGTPILHGAVRQQQQNAQRCAAKIINSAHHSNTRMQTHTPTHKHTHTQTHDSYRDSDSFPASACASCNQTKKHKWATKRKYEYLLSQWGGGEGSLVGGGAGEPAPLALHKCLPGTYLTKKKKTAAFIDAEILHNFLTAFCNVS